MTSFSDLTRQVNLINDLILSDMIYGNEDEYAEETVIFRKHLLATKYWFTRISWANKRRYVLALLEDVRSAWALSLLLKSMWNCRPKDAVSSVSERPSWSGYDRVPMDHNRTAQPMKILAQVMTNDRKWFLTLPPESQAMVLAELLAVGGGPVMWAVLRRAQVLYERYRREQLAILEDLPPASPDRVETLEKAEKVMKEAPSRGKSAIGGASTTESTKAPPGPSEARKQLEAQLTIWNATLKSIRESQKLEEVEVTSHDGATRKIWKVNRLKPEATETVDFLQLLPSSIGKRILGYLPKLQLPDYARVNKYWAYLVEELRAEITVRQKLDADLEKMQELMLKHDTSMDVLTQMPFGTVQSSLGVSQTTSWKAKTPASVRASEKSAGAFSFRHFLDEKMHKPAVKLSQKPLRNLAELDERLQRRGAADEHLWQWCENIVKQARKEHYATKQKDEGVLRFGAAMHFPCPLMKRNVQVPLAHPMATDPALLAKDPVKLKRNILNATVLNVPKEQEEKRYSIWARDFSSLYKVVKVASYQSSV